MKLKFHIILSYQTIIKSGLVLVPMSQHSCLGQEREARILSGAEASTVLACM